MSDKTTLATAWRYQMAEDNNDREATELDEHQPPRHAQSSNHDGVERVQSLQKEQHALKKFWRRQIAVSVDHEGCRDHFGRCQECSSIIRFLRLG